MGAHAWRCPAADAIVDAAISGIGREIEALRIPRLAGVVLGGGYGRGEGGVFEEGDSSREIRLSNDLDLHVVTDRDANASDVRAISASLAPVAERWTAKLGVDVEFCAPKTPARLMRDSSRMMIQELLRGYCDVAGKPGKELFAGVPETPLTELPWSEALRLIVNRGAGLLLCAAPGADAAFVARNIAKAVLGAGDARLVASGRYEFRAGKRAAALADPLYEKALRWKFRPCAEPPCTLAQARETWLRAEAEVLAAPEASRGARRSFSHALRWLARRHTVGPVATLGQDPLLRILRRMAPLVRDGKTFTPSLKRDWEIFN